MQCEVWSGECGVSIGKCEVWSVERVEGEV